MLWCPEPGLQTSVCRCLLEMGIYAILLWKLVYAGHSDIHAFCMAQSSGNSISVHVLEAVKWKFAMP
jgi:hypothetical protein